jgi:hypothetical protein
MLYRIKILCCLAVLFFVMMEPQMCLSQKSVFLGGSVGIAVPTNMGEKEFDIGFADVANAGPRISANAFWFYNPRLSLNGEMAYAIFGTR